MMICSSLPAVAQVIPLQEINAQRSYRFKAGTGLYQMSLEFDAHRFDWESLYVNLTDYNNQGQRTGPWDFELKTARPLLPSYWIKLDGEKLGLWYPQRPSLSDIDAKRFRGRFAFWLRQDGEHTLEFEPYRPANVSWMSARLEHDPEDTLATGLKPKHPPIRPWNESTFPNPLPPLYEKPVQTILKNLRTGGGGQDMLPWLIAARYLDGNTSSVARANATIDAYVASPSWGRREADTYGYNGDIGGAMTLRNLALAAQLLGPEGRDKLLKKLAVQGDAFLTQALLMRDYWGGSLLQDHGWRAMFDFGTAALHLWGVIPEADRWVAYIIPRLHRALAAAPPEGNIPGSSYFSPFLYTQNVMYYRDALLARTGEDILEQPALRRIPAYLATVYDEERRALFVGDNGDKMRVSGCQHLLAALAAKFRDGEAARLHRQFLEAGVEENISLLWGLLAYDPTVTETPAPAKPVRRLTWFKDAGFAHFRDDVNDVALALRCGPWLGENAQRRATGPCDQMECRPGMGHFTLFLHGEPVLASPESGYRLTSQTSSCLLIDGRGQIGDAGYPMSIPSQPHTGAKIESANWDATGQIRLNLQPSYPAELGVRQYVREFRLESGRRLVCRDHIVLERPRRLSWLFQFRKATGATLEPETRIGSLRIHPTGLAVKAVIASTPVVFSYSSRFTEFEHIRYDSTEPVQTTTVDFVMEW